MVGMSEMEIVKWAIILVFAFKNTILDQCKQNQKGRKSFKKLGVVVDMTENCTK